MDERFFNFVFAPEDGDSALEMGMGMDGMDGMDGTYGCVAVCDARDIHMYVICMGCNTWVENGEVVFWYESV